MDFLVLKDRGVLLNLTDVISVMQPRDQVHVSGYDFLIWLTLLSKVPYSWDRPQLSSCGLMARPKSGILEVLGFELSAFWSVARIFMSPLLQNTDGFAGLPSIDRHTNEKSYPSASLSNPMGILDDGLAHFVVWTWADDSIISVKLRSLGMLATLSLQPEKGIITYIWCSQDDSY